MRIVICGGSNYRLMPGDYRRLDTLRAELGITALLSGGTPGAELGAEVWAATRNVTIRRFDAERVHTDHPTAVHHGLASAVADAIVALPGGRNLPATLERARASGLRIYDWRKEAEEEEAIATDLATRVLDPPFGVGQAPTTAVRPRR